MNRIEELGLAWLGPYFKKRFNINKLYTQSFTIYILLAVEIIWLCIE